MPAYICAARPLTSAPCCAPTCTSGRECAPTERLLRAPPSPRLPLSPCLCAACPLTSAPCCTPTCTVAREYAPAERRLRAPPSPRLPLSPCPCVARPLTSAPCCALSCTAARECAPTERRLRAPPSPRLPLSPCPCVARPLTSAPCCAFSCTAARECAPACPCWACPLLLRGPVGMRRPRPVSPRLASLLSCRCFPADAIVTTAHAGDLPITSLKIGDKVLSTRPDGSTFFDDVYMFGEHLQPSSRIPDRCVHLLVT